MISLIAAMDRHRGLGKNNQLLCYLPADLKYFKEVTVGKPVIMGRKTYDSIGKALPGRQNIVVSRTAKAIPDVVIMDSLDRAIAVTSDSPEVMIIGGAQLFEQALPFAERIYITLIHGEFEADVYFPGFEGPQWRCKTIIDRPKDEKNTHDLTFLCYEKIEA